MPIRSSGCGTCRKRKIRCDEGRPGCRRCATHGVQCPGYRTDKPGGIEFKDQTTITVKKANQQYDKRATSFTTAWKSDNAATSPSQSSSISSDGLSSRHSNSTGITTPSSAQATSRAISVEEGSTSSQALVLAKPVAHENGGRPISPIPLLSPTMERARLYNEFVTTYLPLTRGGAQNGHFSFYQTITLKQSDEPALQQGLDALSLVQIGSLYKDQSLLKEGVTAYGKALTSLHRSISKEQFLYDDDVLAAVSVLATCELYTEIQGLVGAGWGKHVAGANQLVAARGPESIRSELALLLYSNMRHGSLLHALINRKAPFMATPEWRRVAFRVPRAALDHSTLFYDMAIQVPGLLEGHDELDLDRPNALESIDHLLADSNRLEADLRAWFIEWQSGEIVAQRIVCQQKPIDDFPTFISLCSDRTVDTAYWFPDFLIAYQHSLYWMVMHYLRTNTQMLHKHRHELEHDWYPAEATVVHESELLGYILNLCKCIPFFVEPISSSTGSVGIFLPMRCATMYFSKQGHWQWLKWVGSVKNSVFVKGLAPPNVAHNRGKVSPGP